MRFPLRDVIPSAARPVLSVTLAVLLATGTLLTLPSAAALPAALLLLCVHLVPLVVLGETVEDQLGRGRYAALLAAAVVLGAWADTTLPTLHTTMLYLAAAVVAGHLSLFPTSRIVASAGFAAVEVPSFFIAGLWVMTVVFARAPLAGATVVLATAALAARRLRRADRTTWSHWDAAR